MMLSGLRLGLHGFCRLSLMLVLQSLLNATVPSRFAGCGVGRGGIGREGEGAPHKTKCSNINIDNSVILPMVLMTILYF